MGTAYHGRNGVYGNSGELPIDGAMEFNPTPTNMTELVVTVLAIVAVAFLMRKRYDSNLPLLFYFTAIIFFNATDREVNSYLLYSGLALALLLRFEFMGGGFAKFIGFLATSSLCLIIFAMMRHVLA